MLDLLRGTNPICSPAWTIAGRTFGEVILGAPPRTRVIIEGEENLPKGPSIICPNHTHKFDFLPIRTVLLRYGMQLMTWIKARDYKQAGMRWILGKGGNVPLASRGYLIARDFVATVGRKPTEDEYRQLREHIDTDAPLPSSLAQSLEHPRDIAGVRVSFDAGYRGALRSAYATLMQESLRLSRQGHALGRHQQVYPQGATSKQLTPGHPGAVQASLALDVPMVPIALSGCREVFVGKEHPLTRGGTLVLRIGQAIPVPRSAVPKSFRPFHPDDEDTQHAALQEQTDRLMEAINVLCEPAYRFAEDGRSDAKRGIARFYA